ncbi:MAG: ABC transporter permease [Lachnospiraceae bacterium]|nr:ABC transporter permease [Lachnospiraceae bacterium]
MKSRNILQNRLLTMIPTFFGITILVYFLANLAPGSPLDAFLADPRITAAELERKRIALGLDKPVIVQYWNWLVNLLHGDMGYSFSSRRAVADLIRERIGATALLAGSSVLLAAVIALPLGVFAASKPRSVRDYVGSFFSALFMSTPNFFLALILIYFVSVKWKLLPSSGMYDSSGEKTLGMLMRHMILPMLVLSTQQMGNWFRQMRAGLLEVMQEDYVRTARAKGLSKWQVITRYGIRNAFIPVFTVISMSVPGLMGGAVVTEQVFGWQGLGTLMVNAITLRDYPVIMGTTVVIALIVLIANMVTDFCYTLLDPRIRLK